MSQKGRPEGEYRSAQREGAPVSGRLVLVPNLLGIVPPEHVLPAHTIETARALRHFVAENAKVARAFLKTIATTAPIQSIAMRELNAHTPEAEIETMLAPALAERFAGALIIGSDQVADLDGEPLGKPGEFDRALRQLQRMRGRVVIFHTAIALLDTRSGLLQQASVPTEVKFRDATDSTLRRYLEQEQPYDCAGSAKAEALGIALTERITSDDPTALIGLPLIAVTTMLAGAGVMVP
jgi:septum formation protein